MGFGSNVMDDQLNNEDLVSGTGRTREPREYAPRK
jgi:hypothetical protein